MKLMEMKLINILLIGLALIANVNCRAIDDDDNDNVIQRQNNNEQQEQTQDWVKITKPPVTKLVNTIGQQIQLECEVMGSPSPSIQWIDGNVQISERDTYATNAITESSSSAIIKVRSILLIDNNDLINKENQYTCIGQAGGKYVSAITTIINNNHNQKQNKQVKIISDLLQLNKNKPKIVYSYTMYLELTGSNIILPCRIHNDNIRTDIYWMDNNNQIIGGNDMILNKNQRIKVLPNGDLLITDLKWSDMGAYKCIAKNPYGKDHADTFVYPAMREDV